MKPLGAYSAFRTLCRLPFQILPSPPALSARPVRLSAGEFRPVVRDGQPNLEPYRISRTWRAYRFPFLWSAQFAAREDFHAGEAARSARTALNQRRYFQGSRNIPNWNASMTGCLSIFSPKLRPPWPAMATSMLRPSEARVVIISSAKDRRNNILQRCLASLGMNRFVNYAVH